MVSMTVKGGAELAAALRGLSEEMRGAALIECTEPSARVIETAARSKIHKVSGETAAGIKAEIRSESPEHVEFLVGVYGKRAHIARFMEFGTDPREQGDGVHPGTSAKPFLRPAIEENKDAEVAAIGERMRVRLESVGR